MLSVLTLSRNQSGWLPELSIRAFIFLRGAMSSTSRVNMSSLTLLNPKDSQSVSAMLYGRVFVNTPLVYITCIVNYSKYNYSNIVFYVDECGIELQFGHFKTTLCWRIGVCLFGCVTFMHLLKCEHLVIWVNFWVSV